MEIIQTARHRLTQLGTLCCMAGTAELVMADMATEPVIQPPSENQGKHLTRTGGVFHRLTAIATRAVNKTVDLAGRLAAHGLIQVGKLCLYLGNGDTGE